MVIKDGFQPNQLMFQMSGVKNTLLLETTQLLRPLLILLEVFYVQLSNRSLSMVFAGKNYSLLHFYGDCTIASLTISDVHLVYCEVDMPIGTPSLQLSSIQLSSEPHWTTSFPVGQTTKVLGTNQRHQDLRSSAFTSDLLLTN